MVQKRQKQDRLLTEVELELMNVIWKLGQATVREVSARHRSKNRALAYTTVATVLKILEQKGFVSCKKDSHAHVFSPVISKSSYEHTCLERVVTNVFDGKPVSLIQRLLNGTNLRATDRQAIEAALKNLPTKGSPKR